MKNKKKTEKCWANGCTNNIEVKKHNLCRTHAMRFYRTGAIGNGKIKKRNSHKPCFGAEK